MVDSFARRNLFLIFPFTLLRLARYLVFIVQFPLMLNLLLFQLFQVSPLC